jgi:acetyl esterase/lipase
VRYANRLAQAGVRVDLHVFPGIVHGTENFVELLPAAQEWHQTCVDALRSLALADSTRPGGHNE